MYDMSEDQLLYLVRKQLWMWAMEETLANQDEGVYALDLHERFKMQVESFLPRLNEDLNEDFLTAERVPV